jgi:copper chaperone CopZ
MEAPMEKLGLEIDSMGCGACVAKVTHALNAVEGVVVERVKVGSAAVWRNPALAGDDTIIKALAAVGYTARKEGGHVEWDHSCCAPGGARA